LTLTLNDKLYLGRHLLLKKQTSDQYAIKTHALNVFAYNYTLTMI